MLHTPPRRFAKGPPLGARPRLAVVADRGAASSRADPVLSLGFDVRAAARDVAAADAILLLSSRATYEPAVRALRGERSTPVVVVLCDGVRSDAIGALESGADDVVVAPYDPLELLARLRAVVRRASPASVGDAVRVGDADIDAQRHEVRRGEHVAALSPTEFALLMCLVRRAGRVVAVDDVACAVWGHASAQTRRSVRTYVKYLRRKLAVPGRPPLIATKRGCGYEISGLGRAPATRC